MGEKKGFNANGFRKPAESSREVSGIHAIAGNVGNIVLAVHDADAAADRFDYIEKHIISDVLGIMPDLVIELHALRPIPLTSCVWASSF
jgi:hypothetical protein